MYQCFSSYVFGQNTFVYEKILYSYIPDFLDANGSIFKHQIKFDEKHSAQYAIIPFVETQLSPDTRCRCILST